LNNNFNLINDWTPPLDIAATPRRRYQSTGRRMGDKHQWRRNAIPALELQPPQKVTNILTRKSAATRMSDGHRTPGIQYRESPGFLDRELPFNAHKCPS
jgi:hypothetical protein